ncbi:hypothetical protein, partial [Streptomyces aureus]|uniref:hypothetical protein n=1 Tax=Streptomyces aureus TaxID=193461 RepID=UPI0033DE370F
MPGSVGFTALDLGVDPEDVSHDMHTLAARVRNLMDLQQGRPFRLPLGGQFFDTVVTAAALWQGASRASGASAVRHTRHNRENRGERPWPS